MSRDSKKLQQLKQEMILIYGLQCWLSGIEDLKLTGHHIIPVRDGGPTTWDNIALLNYKQHQLFNMIENADPKSAAELNGLFQELNRTLQPPTDGYYDEVNSVLKDVKILQKRRN